MKQKNLISVGRLSKEKGFLDLIDVFDIVHHEYPDWKLNIIGNGNELKPIKDKIKFKNLEDNIILHGFQNKDYINKEYHKSSIYVMTSFTESFGIVLLEAFSYGIPAVAFDSAKGAKEMIEDNWNGYLVKDRNKEKMAKRICELIKNENRRIVMGDNAYKKSLQFSSKEIMKKWNH